MLDEKIKLEDYFKDEIDRVSNIEIKQIENEIEEVRERSIQGMESEAQHEAGMEREQLLKEMLSDHAIALSKLHEETNRLLMAKRRELADQVFEEAVAKVKAFTQNEKYKDYLIKKTKDLADKGYGEVVFYVSKTDEKFLSDICKAYGKCSGEVDPTITIGGLRMECMEKGIVVDETFDTGIDEQSEWFYTNSGLFIK
ncbi:V-type ATP synthase subunit E [Amedibacillus sp. YH-ame10]